MGIRHTFAVLALAFAATAFAETRGQPYSEEYLTRTCPLIFVGEVLDVNEFDMPTKVAVLLSVKGNVPAGERALATKDRRDHVIFPEEFDKARKGAVGVFLVGPAEYGAVLMKYKEIPSVMKKPADPAPPGK